MYLAVPSWVFPGTYLENLRFLEDKSEIKGVELLFFLYDAEVKAMLDKEWAEIQKYKARFTFTAHLPDILKAEHEELIEQLMPVVDYCIVHPGPRENREVQGAFIRSWMNKYGIHRFVLENTTPGNLEALLPSLPDKTNICMDTGHLLLDGKSPAAFFHHHRERIKEIHLHSVDQERAIKDGRLPDHRPLQVTDTWFQSLISELVHFTDVINLEVFSWEEVAASIAVLKPYIN